MTFRNIIVVISIFFLCPGLVFGASITSEENSTTAIDSWIEENNDVQVDEDQEIVLVTRRIALEMDSLAIQVSELESLRQESGWLKSIQTAWVEHTTLVQIRRITLLLRSAERQEAIHEDIMSQLNEYLLLVTKEVRD